LLNTCEGTEEGKIAFKMMNNLDILFLQGQPANAGIINLVFIGGIILVFWLFMIRPQAKKQKEQKSFMDDLQKGDKVVTASGILGQINKIEGDIVTLEVGTKTFIQMTRDAISKEMTERVHSGEDA
jgi:preprotein translocase subunit YajC